MNVETMKIQIDARGLSCPQPALLTRQTIATMLAGVVEVLVDTGNQRDNVVRVGQKAGWICTVETTPDGVFCIVMTK